LAYRGAVLRFLPVRNNFMATFIDLALKASLHMTSKDGGG
jgi:hypothetical protein